MRYLNYALFEWIAAGFTPIPWLLEAAALIAVSGIWIGIPTLLWGVWRHPALRTRLLIYAAGGALTAQLARVIAAAIAAPRPFAMTLSPEYVAHSTSGSLPGVQLSAMLVVALACLDNAGLRWLGLWMLAVACVTGWAQIYVGLHFPFDLIASAMLALGVVMVSNMLCSGVSKLVNGRHDRGVR